MNKWLWIGYPVVVVVFIMTSSYFLWGDPARWQEMVGSLGTVAGQEAELARLRRRLGVLQVVDLVQAQQGLRDLLEAVPPAKQVWVLVAQLNQAGESAGTVVEKYKGTGGDAKEASDSADKRPAVLVEEAELSLEATYTVSGLEQLEKVVSSLERTKPLVKISKIGFSSGQVVVGVEGAWQAWEKLDRSDADLPEYRELLGVALKSLEGFEKFTFVKAGTESGSVSDPF